MDGGSARRAQGLGTPRGPGCRVRRIFVDGGACERPEAEAPQRQWGQFCQNQPWFHSCPVQGLAETPGAATHKVSFLWGSPPLGSA